MQTKDWDRSYLNATHASELPYVFNDVAVIQEDMGYRSFDTDEEELAQRMVGFNRGCCFILLLLEHR